MILFFKNPSENFYAVQTAKSLSDKDIQKLQWLFNDAELLEQSSLSGQFIGTRREILTPWSTNAVEITQNMSIDGVLRIEEYHLAELHQNEIEPKGYDPMVEQVYDGLNQDIFNINVEVQPIVFVDDIDAYNEQEGLALSDEEIQYLKEVSLKVGRKLTDSEVFGFSQVNSEHCRHKIFNGTFIIDGEEKPSSLFDLIRLTSKENPNQLVSAYKDNVSFNAGPKMEQFAPQSGDKADFYATKEIETVLSMKAETHNFPTTVEPFNGGATGSGGEIRDRLGGGKASLPSAGISVYMTSYPRNTEASQIKIPVKPWESALQARKWLYQTPEQILIKASNGASDFGNKFGQPLIAGSLFTFEHEENDKKFGYDKVIMLAGGIGYGNKKDALKGKPTIGDKMVLMGGDNYRIGMGGGAVSSVDTGHYDDAVELNAVQRSNPEMQKRVANVIRALAESDTNPIISIHDHGAGGHLNCLSELVEDTGGKIEMSKLPVGDPTMSAKEIVGNESQERMGLLIHAEDVALVQKIAEREQAPMYVIGEATGDMQFVFEQADGQKPIDLQLEYMFGKSPKTVMIDQTIHEKYQAVEVSEEQLQTYLQNVLQMESVACKDWLTNKVDRSVTGLVARQQCLGEMQLPLSDVGVMAMDYRGKAGNAVAVGHAPLIAMVDPAAGSVMAIAEAMTNIVWAPLKNNIESVSLSANWMWPCKNPGEDARLYEAVEACSDFAIALGINIPTGKDSLSMTQKYGDEKVYSPGTVIITASGEVSDVQKTVSPVLVNDVDTVLYHVDFSFDKQKLGASVLAQTLNRIGDEVPTVQDAEYFKNAFETVQDLIVNNLVLAGHDISEGGIITTLLEMCFANKEGGLQVDLDDFGEKSIIANLFAENAGVIIQVKDTKAVEKMLKTRGVAFAKIAQPISERRIDIQKKKQNYSFAINEMRDLWFHTSYLLDRKQSGDNLALERFNNYKNQPLFYQFDDKFTGKFSQFELTQDRKPSGIKAAVIREKGTNGEREMAYALYLAGFDVKDVHMTDLISGKETLEDVNLIAFAGGFSNSDVFGSAKGWAGSFMHNPKAKAALDAFYKRDDTLSLGICNGCQLMVKLGLLSQASGAEIDMHYNESQKFESGFVGISIPQNNSVMLGSLSDTTLGAWFAHGEGKFYLPKSDNQYNIVAKYAYDNFPANPNGSDYAAAAICSADGRHLAMMPHLERAIFPWQWAYYPQERMDKDQVSPWIEAFVNAKKWIEARLSAK